MRYELVAGHIGGSDPVIRHPIAMQAEKVLTFGFVALCIAVPVVATLAAFIALPVKGYVYVCRSTSIGFEMHDVSGWNLCHLSDAMR